MASLKRTARNVRPKPPGKEDICIDGVLELSMTVGYLTADVKHSETTKLGRLLKDHTDAGLVTLERGDLEQHLHFQMVCRARVKSARAFGILVRKYMDWYLVRNMCPASKVPCKVLTNRLLHSWKGMVGYCLKDSGMTHFDCAMYRISDDEVVAGKMLHSIYGKADLKSQVLLTNKNVGERAYVWFKYKENRQLTATMLSTLTDMVNSGMFIPAASWIIPISGLGMDQRRMTSFWRCLTDPANVDKADVADVFIRKREYIKGRYTDDEVSPAVDGNEQQNSDYVFESSPSSNKCLPRSLFVPPFSSTVKSEAAHVMGRKIGVCTPRKLFEEAPFTDRPKKAVKFTDALGDFIPLKDIADLPTNVFLPTSNALGCTDTGKVVQTDAEFWENLRSKSAFRPVAGVDKEAAALEKEIVLLSSDEDSPCSKGPTLLPLKEPSYIILSSDTDEDTEAGGWPRHAASVFEHRRPGKGPAEDFLDGGASSSSYFEGPPKVTFVKIEPTDI